MKRCFIFSIIFFAYVTALAQQQWKLTKEENGIKVFMAKSEHSKFKSIRVQCLLDGSISKLISIMTNVSNHVNWIYKTKKAYIVKQVTPLDFLYYTEASLPWPASNRDGVYHLKISPDYKNNILRMNGSSEPNFTPKNKGLVRVPHANVSWYVTQVGNKLSIDYCLEVDPGGSLPAWLVNMLADKGPFESFQKLAVLLKNQ